eukprot:scaffold116072_cov16-Tisochrysis_lutea.AAC.1
MMPRSTNPVQVRVGMHTGDVVSGLIGSKLPKFSIFGDTIVQVQPAAAAAAHVQLGLGIGYRGQHAACVLREWLWQGAHNSLVYLDAYTCLRQRRVRDKVIHQYVFGCARVCLLPEYAWESVGLIPVKGKVGKAILRKGKENDQISVTCKMSYVLRGDCVQDKCKYV